MDREERRKQLKNKLRDKLTAKKMQRCTNKQRDEIITKSLETMGVDKEKFFKDMEAVKKAGGKLEIDMDKFLNIKQ